MCDTLKNEFKWKNFCFGHGKSEAFYTSQWRWHPVAYLVYRIVVACYSVSCFLAVTLMSIYSSNIHSIMVYLTIWTYLVLTLYMVISAVVAVYCWFARPQKSMAVLVSATANNNTFIINAGYEEEKPKSDSLQNGIQAKVQPVHESFHTGNDVKISVATENQSNSSIETTDATTWYMKLTWLLADVFYVFGLIVTIIYFVAIFPYTGINGAFVNDINMHAVNSVMILIDVAVVARPVRLLHVIYPFIYGTIYTIFSALYWQADRENNVLYKGVLDWNYPKTTTIVVLVLAFIVIPLFQLFHFGLYRLRLFVFQKIHKADYLY